MIGELRSDISRDSFDPTKHYLRVLMQQGRVQLDADWNEQTAILIHYLQTLARDLIGPHGGPAEHCGFEIIAEDQQIDAYPHLNDSNRAHLKSKLQQHGPLITAGRYYVEGLLCENERLQGIKLQPFAVAGAAPNGKPYLAYLDVWEHTVDAAEDDASERPSLREPALGGCDTAARAQIAWQVGLLPLTATDNQDMHELLETCIRYQEQRKPPTQAAVPAPADKAAKQPAAQPPAQPAAEQAPASANRAAIERDLRKQAEELLSKQFPRLSGIKLQVRSQPGVGYHGLENQLYRVEIASAGQTAGQIRPSFVWSRDNGAVTYPVTSVKTDPDQRDLRIITVALGRAGHDEQQRLHENDHVELVVIGQAPRQGQRAFYRVKSITADLHATLQIEAGTLSVGKEPRRYLLRRWESAPIKLPDKPEAWVVIEDGIEVQFVADEQAQYCPGDYWLIPARAATPTVEWPRARQPDKPGPAALPPHGVEHIYAPLAVVLADRIVIDCRHKFAAL